VRLTDLPRSAGGRGVAARLLAFACLFVVAQALYGAAAGGAFERLVIHDLTVRPAAWLIGVLDPAAGVRAEGASLKAPGGGLNVLNGCEGTDVAFLLASAMLVAPLAWAWRLAGVAVALALTFALNQARVLALFYALRADRAWFDALHGFVGPLLLVGAAAAFFAAWLRAFAPVAPPFPEGTS
jgi:exosortase/archaeosortase family protein